MLFPTSSSACFAWALSLPLSSAIRIPSADKYTERYVRYSDLHTCPRLSQREAPSSARDVRPDQIQVIMALGDSLSAGLLARDSVEEFRHSHSRIKAANDQVHMHAPPTLTNTSFIPNLEPWQEYRGLAYPIGLDPGAITFASILSHFTPRPLIGTSEGHHSPLSCAAEACGRTEKDGLNAAISGSVAGSLKSQVTDWLIPRLKEMNVTDEAWKFVNLAVGGNDLCSYCLTPDIGLPSSHSPKQFAQDIKDAIEHLAAHVPNIIINIVGLLRISPLYTLRRRSPKCSPPPLPGPIECSCALTPGPAGDLTRSRMDALAEAYDEALIEVIEEWERQGRESPDVDARFGVIFQPGQAIDLGEWGEDALSGRDCFHPSVRAHERVGAGFWERLGWEMKDKAKPIPWEKEIRIRCLREDDRLPVGRVIDQWREWKREEGRWDRLNQMRVEGMAMS